MRRVIRFLCPLCFRISYELSMPDACYACLAATLRDDDAPKSCLVCDERTYHGKPFCPEHVDQAPYVRQLLDRLGWEYERPNR